MTPAVAESSLLAALARGERRRAGAPEEACELCAAPLAAEHRHLVDRTTAELSCVCRACALLFDRPAAALGNRRLVPEERRRILDFVLDEAAWEALAVPVGLAWFVDSTPAGGVRAAYPGPMGATESLLGLEAWDDLVRDNPVLASLEPDVEALLVRRTGGATASSDVAEHWIVPIDACYRLVAVLRRHWKGLGGGSEVRRAIDGFFDDLRTRSRSIDRQGEPRR